jgi:hypothetical protein
MTYPLYVLIYYEVSAKFKNKLRIKINSLR